MADRVGQQLGNYRLLRLLGQGGQASVYLGEHVRIQRQAAIKILHASLSTQEAEHFQHEAQVIARLEHPHIVTLFDFDVDHGMPFLVMKYYPLGSVSQHHKRGTRLPLQTVISSVGQVADALQYAHENKLVHRDVKPANLLVGQGNELVLTDFGIAAIAHSTSSMSVQALGGTPAYMAPEQIQEYPRPASDQYALAVVAYEWLTGTPPFTGTATEICVKHLSVPPPPLRRHLPDLPEEVEQVILTALAKEPNQRFSNIRAFANALAQAGQASPSISSAQPSLPQLPPVPSPATWEESKPSAQLSQVREQASPDLAQGELPAPITPPSPASPVEETPSTAVTPASSRSTNQVPLTPAPIQQQKSGEAPSYPTSRPVGPARKYPARNTILFLAVFVFLGGGLFSLLYTAGYFRPSTSTNFGSAPSDHSDASTATASAGPYGGTFLFSDSLSDNQGGHGWAENDVCYFSDAAYHVIAKPGVVFWPCGSQRAVSGDFAYEVEISFVRVADANKVSGGLSLGPLDNGYYLEVYSSGKFALECFDTCQSSASGNLNNFQTGLNVWNRLAVVVHYHTFTIWVNGRAERGIAGDVNIPINSRFLFAKNLISPSSSEETSEIAFRNVRVWQL